MTRQQQFMTGACRLLGFLVLAWMIPTAGLATTRTVQRWEAAGKGVNRALVIGINDYQDPEIWDLATAVNDARAVADVLSGRFGFDRSRIIELYNDAATRGGITSAFQTLARLARQSGGRDRVLIYYAGHGEMKYQDRFSYQILDPEERIRMKRFGVGYWVPHDGRRGQTGRYISNSEVRDALSQINAAHILLVADSCYSGGMTERGSDIEAPEKDVAESMALPSRLLLASGGLHPVTDGTRVERCLGHSTFACYFLKALETAPGGYLTTRHLYSQLYVPVVSNSDQEPRLEKFLNIGHEGGQFVFVIEEKGETTLTVEANVSGAWVRLDGRKIGETPLTGYPVTPGEYRLSVGKPGYRTYQRPITVERDRRQSFGVTLLEDEPDDARLFVETEPSNAEVRVVGIGKPFRQGMTLRPGQYEVEVSAPGCKTRTVGVTLSAGSDRHRHIPLECGPPPPGPGELLVEIIPDLPDASVWINGTEFGNSREFTIKSAGEYRVRVTADGYRPVERRVSAGPGESRTVTARMKKIDTGTNEPEPGEIWREPTTGMEFVWVPGGCYRMGSEDGAWYEKPVHEVCVDGFWMGRTEVTNAQYVSFLNAVGKRGPENKPWFETKSEDGRSQITGTTGRFQAESGHENYPAVNISWHGANAFAEWLGGKGRYRFRLPSEAEWEYACRSGGRDETYSGGEDVDRVAWYTGNSGGKTHQVGTKDGNGLGLSDMSGNVLEWCLDVFDGGAYAKHDRDNPIYAAGNADIYTGDAHRVSRGGSWEDSPSSVRCANRDLYATGDRRLVLGFRLLRTR